MTNNKIHLAIIPDGNRRWAKKQLLKPWDGHRRALNNSRDLIEWCRQNPRVDILTFWGFSPENWDRAPEEINQLMQLFEEFLQKQRNQFVEQKTRLLHSGRTDRIPATLSNLINDIVEETKQNSAFTFHLALDYGGRDEIIRAVHRITPTELAGLNIDHFHDYLDQPDLPNIDLVIRTSGEYRTSGFFIWQTAYAEWIFESKLYPDITTKDLESYLIEYDNRHRRYGR